MSSLIYPVYEDNNENYEDNQTWIVGTFKLESDAIAFKKACESQYARYQEACEKQTALRQEAFLQAAPTQWGDFYLQTRNQYLLAGMEDYTQHSFYIGTAIELNPARTPYELPS